MRKLSLSLAAALVTLTPVLVSAPSEAATMRTWERLAWCESTGRWHVNTGNGYYGGLQISPSTWRGHGGARFARLPHQATKREQVKVAERIKSSQGWGAWPSCSRKIGVR